MTEQLLEEEGWKFSLDTGWTNWDLHIFASRWWNLRLRSMTEIYPHGRRLTRVGNFMNVSTFSSLVGGLLFTFSLVIMLTQQQVKGKAGDPIISLIVLGIVSLLASVWFIHGLRLRHRLAELVEVAAIRAGLDDGFECRRTDIERPHLVLRLEQVPSHRPAHVPDADILGKIARYLIMTFVLMIALSQSGATPEIISTCRAVRDAGATVIGITSEPGSPLAAAVDLVLATEAGPELAVPATNRNARTVSDCISFVRIVFPPQISF